MDGPLKIKVKNSVLTTVFLRPRLALFLWETRLAGFGFAEGYNFFMALLARGLCASLAGFVLARFFVPDPDGWHRSLHVVALKT